MSEEGQKEQEPNKLMAMMLAGDMPPDDVKCLMRHKRFLEQIIDIFTSRLKQGGHCERPVGNVNHWIMCCQGNVNIS